MLKKIRFYNIKETGGDLVKKDNYKNRKERLSYFKLNYDVLEGMADWVRVIDKKGIVIYANKSMKDDLDPEIIANKFIALNSRTRKGVVQREIIIDGEIYSVKSSPVQDDENSIIGHVEVFRNVTREKRLEIELINKNMKMLYDLEFSRRIQEKILPKKQRIENLNIDYIYKPSEILGGNIFDIYRIDEENIGFYMSKLLSNGVSTALMTMFIRQTMRFIKDFTGPRDVLKHLNKNLEILNIGGKYYFNIFFAIFNTKTNKFKYVNTGYQCRAIRYNSREKFIKNIEIKGLSTSPRIDEYRLAEREIQLRPGDKIVFYTDTPGEDREKVLERFDTNKLEDLIRRESKDLLKIVNDEILKKDPRKIDHRDVILLIEVLD